MVSEDPAWLVGHGIAIVRDTPLVSVVRARGATAAMLGAVGEALGARWPVLTSGCVIGAEIDVCCVGPGEWVVIGAPFETVRRHVSEQSTDALYHVSDISSAWARWRLSGVVVLEVLAKGCSLDLEQLQAQDAGVCARTLLGQVNALIYCWNGEWRVYAERALSAHLETWFLRATREFRSTRMAVQ